MKVFKLTELYNTRYFYLTYCVDLNYLFSTVERLKQDKTAPYNIGNDLLGQVYEAVKNGEEVVFDLAGCKLTPDTSSVLKMYYNCGINFIDSEDSCRNQILMTNKERLKIDTSSFTELPMYDASITIKEYINSLDRNVTYKMPENNKDIFIPLVYMILVSRPSIKVNIGAHCSEFFNFVGSRLTLEDIDHYTEFYLTTQEGTIEVDFSGGKVKIQRLGLVDKEQALTVGTLVPTIFGKENLVKEDCWRAILQECLNRLNGYRSTRKKTLGEILT